MMNPSAKEEKVCFNCKFWKQSPRANTWGRCHRYPPQYWSESGSCGADFVGVDGNEWCGEFQKKEEKK